MKLGQIRRDQPFNTLGTNVVKEVTPTTETMVGWLVCMLQNVLPDAENVN